MKALLRTLFYFLCILALSSCVISAHLPVSRTDSPEAIGKAFRVQVDGGLETHKEVELSPNYLNTAPNTINPVIKEDAALRVGAGIGLSQNVDLQLRFPFRLQAKVQFLGEPRLTAKEGNWSLAATFSTGYERNKDNSGPNSYELRNIIVDASIIGGYRVTPGVLFFGGPFFAESIFWGDYNVPSVIPNARFSGRALAGGFSLGAEFGTEKIQARVGVGYSVGVSGKSNGDDIMVGIDLCVHFDPTV